MKHASGNIISFPGRAPAIRWVGRRYRVSPDVARLVAELAGLNVDTWTPLGDAAANVIKQTAVRR